MNMIGLASDFDGTLFHGKQNDVFLSCDLTAIQRFQQNGNLFGVCTGRPLHAILDVTLDRISYDFYILSSGAVVLDREKNILFQKCLTPAVTEAIFVLYQNQFSVVIQGDNKVYSFQKSNDMPTKQKILASFDELNSIHIYGISIMCNSDEQARLVCQQLQQRFPDDIEAFQNLHYVDIVSKGCSKGAAMDILKQHSQISFLGGIGDSYNDEPMLKQADISFTFHHSPAQIQQLSNYLVDSVAEAIHIMEGLPD